MKIPDEILDLIHAELDGVATDAQKARLREAIASDPAVRDEHRRLLGLCEALAQVAPEEPPAHLVPGVMWSVRSQRRASRSGILDRVRDAWPGGRVAIRYAYAVAAGAVIGILGLHMASGGSLFGPAVPDRDASATLMPVDSVNRLDLAKAGVRGFATLRPSAGGAAIGLDLAATEPVELVLRFDPAHDGGRVEVAVVHTGRAVPAGTLRLPIRN
jgi:anti-sigma factor RsiW